MKSATKKMILIPEEEYITLTRLFTGDDPMKVEKARTDMQIRRVLTEKGLTPLEIGKKYDLLAKKRRKLLRRAQTEPETATETILETKAELPAPTTGIVPAQVPPRMLQQVQQTQEEEVPKIPKVKKQTSPEIEEIAAEEQTEEPEKYSIVEWNRILKNLDGFHGILDRERYDFIYDYVDKNKRKLGILANGQVAKNSSKPEYSGIAGSSFEDVLLYLTGQQKLNTDNILAYQKLIPRLYKDKAIFKHFTRKTLLQEGKGRRRYIVDLKYQPIKHKKLLQIKTPGLQRKPQFRPKLWTRIGV